MASSNASSASDAHNHNAHKASLTSTRPSGIAQPLTSTLSTSHAFRRHRSRPHASTRPAAQRHPEFFTRSLDSTLIPSPSPGGAPSISAASQIASPRRLKPRPAPRPVQRHDAASSRSAAGGLQEGFEAAHSLSHESEGLISSSVLSPSVISSGVDSTHSSSDLPQNLPLPSSTPEGTPSGFPSSSSTARPATASSRARTPSPRRDVSFNMSTPTSPPLGLMEAYKRITDEEDLAAQDQESNSDYEAVEEPDQTNNSELERTELSTDFYKEHKDDPPGLADSFRSQKASLSDSQKPLTRSSSVHLDDAFLTTDSISQPEVDPIMSASRIDSVASRRSSQHERDAQRIKEIQAAQAQHSGHSRTRRSGVTLEDLSRDKDSDRRQEDSSSRINGLRRDETGSLSEGSSPSSNRTGSRLSDPSANIPSTWGRRARNDTKWLSRITDEVKPAASEALSPTKDNGQPRTGHDKHQTRARQNRPRSKLDAVAEWAAESATKTVPPRVDKTENSHQNLHREATRLKTAVAQAKHWDQPAEEQTNGLSSELEKHRPQQDLTIDVIRAREAAEKNSEPFADSVNIGAIRSEPSSKQRKKRAAPHHDLEHPFDHALGGAEGEAIPNSPVVVFRGRSQSPSSNIDQARSLTKEGQKPPSRDTRDVLRKLARVESLSPDPSAEPKHLQLKTPIVTGAWVDTPLPKKSPSEKAGLKPASSRSALQTIQDGDGATDGAQNLAVRDQQRVKTDHTMAENLPTNASTTPKVKPNIANAKSGAQATKEQSIPFRPSALREIITQAKKTRAEGNVDDTLQLNDSTIESLEALVAEGRQFDLNVLPKDLLEAHLAENKIIETGHSNWSKRGQRSLDDGLSVSISQSKADVDAKFENVPTDGRQEVASTSAKPQSSVSVKPSNARAEDLNVCDDAMHGSGLKLSTPARDSATWEWKALQIPTPRLWTTTRKFGAPWPTRMGCFVAIALASVLAEIILHDMYSPPFYAATMQGFGVDIDAPRPPFVLAQLLWRHLLGPLLAPLVLAIKVIVRLLAGLTGTTLPTWFFGYADRGAFESFAETAAVNTQSFAQAASRNTQSWGVTAWQQLLAPAMGVMEKLKSGSAQTMMMNQATAATSAAFRAATSLASMGHDFEELNMAADEVL